MTLKAGRMNHRTTPVANVGSETVGFWEGLKAAFRVPSKAEKLAAQNKRPLAPAAITKARINVMWPATAKTLVKQPSPDSEWAQEEEMNRRMYEELDALYAKKP